MNVNHRQFFHVPTAIEFGQGTLFRLPALAQGLGAGPVLVVGDPGVVRAGHVRRVLDVLGAGGLTAEAFTEVESDPDIRSVMDGAARARAIDARVVVGVGGGSALDVSKAIGLMLGNEGHIRDYVGIDRVPRPGAPVIALPTTAGTGSEVTIWSVLTDAENHEKVSVGSALNCPRIALLDPELTTSLPPAITAATGMDALTHAIESYVCRATQPISEALAERAITMIGRSLLPAVRDGTDLAARGEMLMASTLAGMAFNNTRLGLAHAFALPLGAKFAIPHGLVNAITLPGVMRFNLPSAPEKFARIAALLGERVDGLPSEAAAPRAVEAVTRLRAAIGITARLPDFGVTADRLDEVVAEAKLSGNVAVNPRASTPQDLRAILEAEIA